MARLNVSTRWRELDNPVSPFDPIQPDGPKYEAGKLPVGFILMLWDGTTLMGPYRFDNRVQATLFLQNNPKVTHFLIIPSPDDTYETEQIPGL